MFVALSAYSRRFKACRRRIALCYTSSHPQPPRTRMKRMPYLVVVMLLAARAVTAQEPPSDDRLLPGQRVEIKGELTPDGSIAATRIRLHEPDSGAKIEGRVVSVDHARRRLTIGGFAIAASSDVRVERGDAPATLDDVRVGDVVEAKGRWSETRLRASRLRIREDQAAADAAPQQAEIEADIEQADGRSRVVVLGHPVRLLPGGKIVDERTPVAADASPDRLRREVDDVAVAPLHVTEWLTVGGRVGGDLRGHRYLGDGDDAEDGRARQDMASAAGQLLASAVVGRYIELYGKVGTEGLFTLVNHGGPFGSGKDLRVREAHATIGTSTPLSVQVGRQRFRDAREWFYDDYLDAVRLHFRRESWRVEAAVAEGVFAGPAPARSRSDQRHGIVSFTTRVGERSEGSAFWITRHDRARDERPSWIGGEWNGRPISAVKYWGVGAVRRGESRTERLGGWAADSGIAVRLPVSGTPALNVSYAVASGDRPDTEGEDGRFRQSGLEDNRTRLHGLKRFARYGEVLDPELSNLSVLSFGAGVKPFSRTSVDVMYHRFQQRERRRSLPSNRLDATGNGTSLDLGRELDVVLSVQEVRRMDFSVVVGVFWPGPGVATPSRAVLYWKPEIRWFF
jgi:hypothetical protein